MNSIDTTDRVIINLKVISGVKEGQRICTRNNSFFIQEPGWMQSLSRWINQDTRWANLTDIKAVIDDSLRILGTYMTLVHHAYGKSPPLNGYNSLPVPTLDASLNYIKTLSKEIESAITGLEKLKITYSNDTLMIANLDVLIEKSVTEIGKAKNMLQQNVENSSSSQVILIRAHSTRRCISPIDQDINNDTDSS